MNLFHQLFRGVHLCNFIRYVTVKSVLHKLCNYHFFQSSFHSESFSFMALGLQVATDALTCNEAQGPNLALLVKSFLL